jgi:hypothetical protein
MMRRVRPQFAAVDAPAEHTTAADDDRSDRNLAERPGPPRESQRLFHPHLVGVRGDRQIFSGHGEFSLFLRFFQESLAFPDSAR